MKKILLISVALLTAGINAKAQDTIPNANMEYWTAQGSFEDPNNWATANILSLLGSAPISVTKSTPAEAYQGQAAAKIQTVKITNNPAQGQLPDTVGALISGAINLSGLKYGFMFVDTPKVIGFQAKYLPNGIDTGFVQTALTRWDAINAVRDTVAKGFRQILPTPYYRGYNVVFDYLIPGVLPDSASIIFSSSKRVGAKIGSTLFIDAIARTTVGINETEIPLVKMDVFPNPAGEVATLKVDESNASDYVLFDLQGKKVLSGKLEKQQAKLNFANLATGTYLLQVYDNAQQVLATQKIQHVNFN